MKKLILTLFLFSGFFANSQYCTFFDFEAKEPEMVVSTLKGMMETGWGKNIQGTKSLFAYQFNGTNKATHSVQFCFPDEKSFASFFSSFQMSADAQLFAEKIGKEFNLAVNSVSEAFHAINVVTNDSIRRLQLENIQDDLKYSSF